MNIDNLITLIHQSHKTKQLSLSQPNETKEIEKNPRAYQTTFTTTSVESLKKLFTKERQITNIESCYDEKQGSSQGLFQLEQFIRIQLKNVNRAIVFDRLPMECTSKNKYVKEGEKMFENGRYNYYYGVSDKKAHKFTDPQYEKYNILYSTPTLCKAVNKMGEIGTYYTNVFHGAANTMTEFHRDFTGANGLILNETGKKLFLFADYAEVERNRNRLFTVPVEKSKMKPTINMEVLNELKSFHWCILEYGQYIYWDATIYHAIYNITNSTFISPGYVALSDVERWMEWVLADNLRPSDKQIEAAFEVIDYNLQRLSIPNVITTDQVLNIQNSLNKHFV